MFRSPQVNTNTYKQMKVTTSKTQRELVIDFKKWYIQINGFNMFGLGFSLSNAGLSIVLAFFYIGLHSKNGLFKYQ